MNYKVLKTFKCRHQDFKVFQEGDDYKPVNEQHTEKLLQLKFIEEKKRSPARKKVDAE